MRFIAFRFKPVMLTVGLLADWVFSSPAQTIIKNFSGLNLNDISSVSGFILTPPDTMGAAGTNHFVEFVNGAFGVFDKAGNRLLLESDKNFWLNAGISSGTMSAGLSDPRIFFDARSGRWFATEITVDSTNNKVLIARSDTFDPTGIWKGTNFVGSSTGFADYDTLGVDALGVYVAASIFNAAGRLQGQSLFSIPKADLLAATPSLARMTRFDNISDQTYGFTLQGVCSIDAGAGHGVVVAIDNVAFNWMDRTTINGPGAAGATLSSRVRIPLTYDTQPNLPTPPNGQTVDVPDDRFPGAARQVGGYIFCANTIVQGSKDAVHWVVLNETNNAVIGEGVISDSNYDYFQPAIAANHAGKILLGFNRCGTAAPAGYLSVYAAVGTLTNGTVTMGAPFVVQAGTLNYTGLAGVETTTPYRWGDYSATCVDPADENLFWTIQEIPVAAGTWGTQITLISMTTNTPSLAIAPAQYAFAYSRTNRNNQVYAVSNVVSMNLSWPLSTDPSFLLQTSTNLAAPTSWTAVTNSLGANISQNVVTVAVTNLPTFFRLKK